MNRKQTFIKSLQPYIPILPKQTIKTLKGQALSGNVEGAMKGLEKVLRRYRADLKRNTFRKAHENTRYILQQGKTEGTYRQHFSESLIYIYKTMPNQARVN